jgi:hypothetical protein
MKKKALVVVLVCVLGIALSFSNAMAVANPPWYNCTITSVNAVGAVTTLVMSNPAFPGGATYYNIDPANPRLNTYVAIALTAFSAGVQVAAYIPDLTPGAVILYLGAGPL